MARDNPYVTLLEHKSCIGPLANVVVWNSVTGLPICTFTPPPLSFKRSFSTQLSDGRIVVAVDNPNEQVLMTINLDRRKPNVDSITSLGNMQSIVNTCKHLFALQLSEWINPIVLALHIVEYATLESVNDQHTYLHSVHALPENRLVLNYNFNNDYKSEHVILLTLQFPVSQNRHGFYNRKNSEVVISDSNESKNAKGFAIGRVNQ